MANPNDPRLLAGQQIAPLLAELRRQQAEEKTRAANQQATATASASGLNQVLGEIPGRIQEGHAKAANSVFEYGRQIGLQYAGGSKADAAGTNEFLAKQGSPQQVTAAGDAGGQVLAGLGGYLPGSALQAQGAALSAGAESFGAGALLRGQETSAAISRDSASRLAQLDALMRGEKAKLPGLVQDITARQADDVRADRELGLRERAANEKSFQVFGSADTGFMRFDPKTGKVVRITDPLPPGSSSGDVQVIGSDASGRYAYNEATGEMALLTPPVAKPKFTAKELRGFKQDAANMAYDAFWGIKDKNGDITAQPKHYQQAMAWMLDQQIPLEIAQNALNRYWTKPGFWSYPQDRANGTVRWIDSRKQSEKGATGRPLKAIQERKPQGEQIPVDPAAEASANAYGGTTVLNSKSVPGWNDKSIPTKMKNVLAIAHAQIGKPYVWGAESPAEGGFDCSGLIEYAFEQAGIPTPGRLTTYSAMQLGKPVKGPMKPGDWIITNGGKHMVMYVGKGQVIAAPRRGEVVQYQPVSRFKGQIVGVRRFA